MTAIELRHLRAFVAVADDLAHAADPYEGLALRRLKADLRSGQEALTRKIMGDQAGAGEALAAWIERNGETVSAVAAAVERIEKSPGSWTLAKLLVAVSALLKL